VSNQVKTLLKKNKSLCCMLLQQRGIVWGYFAFMRIENIT